MRTGSCIALTCVFMLGLQSCGIPRLEEQQAKRRIIRNSSGTPVQLLQEDQSCSLDRAVPHLGLATVTFFENQEEITVPVDLTGLSGSGQASTAGLSTVRIHASHVIKRNFSDKNPSVKLGDPLYFCREHGGYARRSLENAALATSFGILRGYHAYEKVRTNFQQHALQALPPITLLMQPETFEAFRYKHEEIQEVLTDNAMWFSAPGQALGNFFISVLAHSKERERKYPGKFWEQPAILAHEYGHHVFFHLTNGKRNQSNEPLARLAERHRDEQTETPIHNLLKGIEEGFSDLFAYLSFQNANDPVFSGRLQFDYGRDIANKFLLRTKDRKHPFRKRFDDHYLAVYFQENNRYLPQVIEYLRDEHALGAVVAFTLHAVFSQAEGIEDLGPEEASLRKLSLLLLWGQRMGRSAGLLDSWPDNDAQTLLSELMYLAVQSIASRNFSEAQCSVMAAYFPAFYPQWLKDERLPGC